LPITVSVGLTAARKLGSDLADVLRDADGALYDAKRNGRNRVVQVVSRPDPGRPGDPQRRRDPLVAGLAETTGSTGGFSGR
jgi:hypothetical protein